MQANRGTCLAFSSLVGSTKGRKLINASVSWTIQLWSQVESCPTGVVITADLDLHVDMTATYLPSVGYFTIHKPTVQVMKRRVSMWLLWMMNLLDGSWFT